MASTPASSIRRRVPFVLGLFAAAALAAARPGGADAIDRFYRVNEQVATGAQPTVSQIADLAREGFRTIMNLREPGEYDSAAEEAAARELGLRYVSIPVKTADPKVEQLDAFLNATADPTIYPAFLHCGSGNRVGAFWMVRRVLVDGWSVPDAETEAVQIGMKSPNLREFALDYIQRHAKSTAR
ncbi:MAG TPA: protein tyrosine phosphatase family protein [Thermoanaerobaculia bacterium]